VTSCNSGRSGLYGARIALYRTEVLNAANLAFMEDFEAVVEAVGGSA
jgi:hypothetical protein